MKSTPKGPTLESAYWLEKWQQGDTRFHRSDVNPRLTQFWSELPAGKVLVPLCGKSLDLLWLSRSHQVVGVELSELACESFFTESQLKFRKSSTDEFICFQGAKTTLWCGDFFKLPPAAWSGVNLIYDRAALIALPQPLRLLYSQKLMQVAKACPRNFQMLLIALDYPVGAVEGPPFAVTADEVTTLYAPSLQVELKLREADENLTKNHPKFLQTIAHEAVYLLSKPDDL